jgi:hypothetical protein
MRALFGQKLRNSQEMLVKRTEKPVMVVNLKSQSKQKHSNCIGNKTQFDMLRYSAIGIVLNTRRPHGNRHSDT